jgi:hypothetical protein
LIGVFLMLGISRPGTDIHRHVYKKDGQAFCWIDRSICIQAISTCCRSAIQARLFYLPFIWIQAIVFTCCQSAFRQLLTCCQSAFRQFLLAVELHSGNCYLLSICIQAILFTFYQSAFRQFCLLAINLHSSNFVYLLLICIQANCICLLSICIQAILF